jgi:8-oxo-dGTP diphosphatase
MAKSGKAVSTADTLDPGEADGPPAPRSKNGDVPIKAAGGVVLRIGPDGPEVLIVHRPRYDDWSFPKGKNEPGETPPQAAIREVIEETGQPVRLITSLGKTRFETGVGIKEVKWFVMKATRPSTFIPNAEVDQIRWVAVEEAGNLLKYDADRSLLNGIDANALLKTGTLWLVRHGAAGDRNEWEGEDRLRPLSKKGQRQVQAIADYLAGRDIETILSSPYLRCVQTVTAPAEAVGLEVIEHEALAEGQGGKATKDLVRDVIGTNAVLCSHGDVIPALIDWMLGKGMSLGSPYESQKGSIWEIEVREGQFRKARYVPPRGD